MLSELKGSRYPAWISGAHEVGGADPAAPQISEGKHVGLRSGDHSGGAHDPDGVAALRQALHDRLAQQAGRPDDQDSIGHRSILSISEMRWGTYPRLSTHAAKPSAANGPRDLNDPVTAAPRPCSRAAIFASIPPTAVL